ncbi:toxin HicA [Enteractinococcus helveticum]|uniref:Toxin HicA n=2 Tax=Enteractinococcus helveticum TaxID=1837282 RepID=A0A1B7M2F7_9MICC|nr:toxin HicA [Enteractinococcus helveticum]
MVKPMKYRDLAKLLREAGFTASMGKGDHELWRYPGIDRPLVIPKVREVSPGVTRIALNAIKKKQGSTSND